MKLGLPSVKFNNQNKMRETPAFRAENPDMSTVFLSKVNVIIISSVIN